MSWLGINPNCLSEEVKQACKDLLGIDPEAPEELTPREVARAFNYLDLEVCKLTYSNRVLVIEGEEESWEEDYD